MSQSRRNLPAILVGTLLAGALGFGLSRGLNAFLDEDDVARARPLVDVQPDPPALTRLKLPVTKMQPSLGPVDALVTIVEFCDLRGPVCRAADAAMKAIVREHPDDVRWVHRHRMDPSRADESLRLHQLARAAFQQAGKFWELRERTLALPDGNTLSDADFERLAEAIGLDYAAAKVAIADRHYDTALQLDDHFTHKFGVIDPVGFFVNGRPLDAPARGDFAQRLERLVDEELAVARARVAQGVAKADLYTDLTKDGAFDRAADGTLSARAPGGR